MHVDRRHGAERRVGLRADDPACPAAARQPRRALAHDAGLLAGQDGAGSGVANYTVEVSEGDRRRRREPASDWKTLARQAPALNGLHFRGDSGDAYQFRITASDRALNRTTIVTDPLC